MCHHKLPITTVTLLTLRYLILSSVAKMHAACSTLAQQCPGNYAISTFLNPFPPWRPCQCCHIICVYPSVYLHVHDLKGSWGRQSHHCQLWTSWLDGQSCPQQLAGPHMSPWELRCVQRHSVLHFHPVRGPHCQAAGRKEEEGQWYMQLEEGSPKVSNIWDCCWLFNCSKGYCNCRVES